MVICMTWQCSMCRVGPTCRLASFSPSLFILPSSSSFLLPVLHMRNETWKSDFDNRWEKMTIPLRNCGSYSWPVAAFPSIPLYPSAYENQRQHLFNARRALLPPWDIETILLHTTYGHWQRPSAAATTTCARRHIFRCEVKFARIPVLAICA